MKNTMTKSKAREIKVIDASGKTLGRVASEVAISLMGKNKTSFERNKYCGLPVKVINTTKLRITAKKLENIYHTRYSGIPGGLRITKGTETAFKLGLKELVKMAIYKMLPSNKLRRTMMKNLTIKD
jgi:large subunit ribosomal protein L13